MAPRWNTVGNQSSGRGENRPLHGSRTLCAVLADAVLEDLAGALRDIAQVTLYGEAVDLLVLGGKRTLIETAEHRE